ncbi:uncharacterized protein L203_103220 [Cryptococcus depauperatus CBS 7841]|uniref:Uncharacterized protein n=1 Tax=Cryptococcus depauperatus CBS 7841 TaxID=1295531 RepID=A0AAJ8M1T7_9TREE
MSPHGTATWITAPHRSYKRDDSASSAFFIPDRWVCWVEDRLTLGSSPLISYAPKSDSSPWTAGYALQTDGYDQTLHATTTSNSTISFNVSSTSLTLLISTFDSCAATVAINTSAPVPACASNSTGQDVPWSVSLPFGTHVVTWSSGPVASGEKVIFWGIKGSRPSPSGTNVTFDDTYLASDVASFEYKGDWTHLGSGAGMQTSLSEAGNLSNDFNKTLAITQKKGASVTFSGSGPDYGGAQISLNGQVVAPFMNLTSPWSMAYELLWFTTNLDASQTSNITMTNLDDKKMALDVVVLTAEGDVLSKLNPSHRHSSFISTTKGKLIVSLVPALVLLLAAIIVWYFIRRRRHPSLGRRNSRESSMSLKESSGKGEKKRGWGWGSESGKSNQSGRSSPETEVDDATFFSYLEGKSQRMSDKWYSSPTTSSPVISNYTAKSGISPGTALETVSESIRSGITLRSPFPETAREGEGRIMSVSENDYATTRYGNSRRGTALPAYTYTPEGTSMSHYTSSDSGNSGARSGTSGSPSTTSPSSRYLTIEEEKVVQLRIVQNVSSFTPPPPVGPSSPPPQLSPIATEGANGGYEQPERTSTIAPSDIISVFGAAPGSERRMSIMTDRTSRHSAWYSRPGSGEFVPPIPTSLPYLGRDSAGSGSIPEPFRLKINTNLVNNPHESSYMTPSALATSSGSNTITPGSSSTKPGSSTSKSTTPHAFNLPHLRGQSIFPPSAYNQPSFGSSSSPGLSPKGSSTSEAGSSGRSQHKRALSNHSQFTVRSAARPDSEVIPFEHFISGLDAATERKEQEKAMAELEKAKQERAARERTISKS